MTAVELTERTHALAQAGGKVYAARQSGIYITHESGEEQSLFRGWPTGNGLPTLALAVDTAASLLLAGIHGGIARSADGGRNWEAIAFRAPPPLVTCLASSPGVNDEGWLLAGTFEDGVFRSVDGGKHWRASNHGLFDQSVNCLAYAPDCLSEGIIYAGTSSGLYASENGGKLWRDMQMPAGDETVLSLALSTDGAAIAAGTESQGLLHSADGGQSWTRPLETGGAVNAIALTNDGALVALVDDAVLRSSADGGSWVEIAAGGVDLMLLDAESEQLILALSSGVLRREAL